MTEIGTVRQDLLTVANTSFQIRCDDRAYDDETRDVAWDLWCLALELLSRHEQRLAVQGKPSSVPGALVAFGPRALVLGRPALDATDRLLRE